MNTDAQFFTFVIEDHCRDVRLDQFLARNLGGLSRSRITAAIKAASITVNGEPEKPGYRLKAGDTVSGSLEHAVDHPDLKPQEIDFTVLIEEKSFLVLAKPAGLVVHPGSGNKAHTLVHGLLHRYRDLHGVGTDDRPGIVHRLDKDTSGVMIVARTPQAHAHLMKQFKDRTVDKSYLALIHGRPDDPGGRIVAPIGRHPVNRQKMAIREQSGRYAVSVWKRLKTYDRHTLVEVSIETGRTHQIRVHMADLGFPVAGDRVYGGRRDNSRFPRQLLHSWRLRFHHPETGQLVQAEAGLPRDFQAILDELEEGRC